MSIQEHCTNGTYIQTKETNRQNSKFSQHMLNSGHIYSTIDLTVEVLHIEKGGQRLNTLETFHIYNLRKQALQMNDTFTDSHNPIFDLIIET